MMRFYPESVRRFFRWSLHLFFVLFILNGCQSVSTLPPPEAPTVQQGHPKPYRVGKQWYQPIPDAEGFRQRGTASWYGKKFHGRRTSNGETYDMYGISAAHKTLPFNTVVRVHNLRNGRKLDIRINDRGPFVQGRIIDLSYGAANKLGVVGPGTAPVEIVALAAPARTVRQPGGQERLVAVDLTSGNFTFQVGAFQDRNNAERLAAKLRQTRSNVHVASFNRGDGMLHRVRVGRTTTLKEADEYEQGLIREGYDVIIVAE
jgi:peptidoglycan lytic transglycosylase